MQTSELTIWWKKIFILLILGAALYIAYILSSIIIMIFLAGCITLVTYPLIEKWEQYKIPAWMSITSVYLVVFLFGLIIIGAIVPIFIEYITRGIESITATIRYIQITYTTSWIEWFQLPKYIESWLQLIIGNASLDNIFYLLERNAEAIQSVLKNSLSLITNSSITVIGNIGSTITQSMLVIIMSFLMSLERKAIGKFLLEVIPSKFHQYIKSRFHSTQKIIGHWMKWQLILGGSIFIVTFIGLSVCQWIFDFDTERVFTLALIAGLMEFIPYIGPFIALLPALVIGLWISWKIGFIILILYIIIQQIENNILVPIIMSKSLELSPFLVFIVMLAGWSLGGIIGIILAVPFAAIIRMLTIDYIRRKNTIEKNEQEREPKTLLERVTGK